MQRVEFTIIDGSERPLCEPAFVERKTDLPMAVMAAMNDFLEAYDGELTLPLRIEINSANVEAA